MKDRIVAYFKGLLRSWKFWMAVLMGIFMAWAFADGVKGFGKILGSILGGFVVGYMFFIQHIRGQEGFQGRGKHRPQDRY